MSMLPPVTVAGAANFTMPQRATLARVTQMLQANGSGIDLRLDGTAGAQVAKVSAGTVSDAFASVELGIQLDSGRVIHNSGDSTLLIFS